MNMLRNFTIRFVMLTILGIFCLMWAGVGLYSTWSLSRVSDGNEVDRQLVKQMTVLSQGNDQYFRFVTRLSRAMEVKAAGGTPDLSSAQQALDNMGKKLAELSKHIFPDETAARWLGDIAGGRTPGTYPVAQGIVFAACGISEKELFCSHQYGVVNMVVSAALRCVRVSHYDTQRILFRTAEKLGELYDTASDMDFDDMYTFVPQIDILASLHEKGTKRMFMN